MGTDLIESPKELVELTTRCEEELRRSNELDERFGQLCVITMCIIWLFIQTLNQVFSSLPNVDYRDI